MASPMRLVRQTDGQYVVIGMRGDLADVDDRTEVEVEGVRLLRRVRQLHLSVRGMYQLPRMCSRRQLDELRVQLTPYPSRPHTVEPVDGHRRSAASSKLRDIVVTHVTIAEGLGVGPPLGVGNRIRVLVCVDATPFFKASATRADVFVDVWGDISVVGQQDRWSTWFAVDGGDDAKCVRAIDRVAKLNNQVIDLEDNVTINLADGRTMGFVVMLTGDGSGMAAGNEKMGCRCWLCTWGSEGGWDGPLEPHPLSSIEERARYGAFLARVVPRKRVGDYAHANCRVMNIFMKRLLSVAHTTYPECHRKIREFIEVVRNEAASLPTQMRLNWRPSKAGQLDLTSSRLFATSQVRRQQLVALVRSHMPAHVMFRGKDTPLYVVILILLDNYAKVHDWWRMKRELTATEMASYKVAITHCGQCWTACKWKVSTWVHWAIVHSHALLELHKSIYFFSSIPTERKHQPFKKDWRHVCPAYRLSNPRASLGGMVHLLRQHALDLGLWVLRVREGNGLQESRQRDNPNQKRPRLH